MLIVQRIQILRNANKFKLLLNFKAKYSSITNNSDPNQYFMDDETQNILKSISQFRLSKIFHKTSVDDSDNHYQFMTEKELDDKISKLIQTAKLQLQMYPVIKIKKDENVIISYDTSLKDVSESKYVIADITNDSNVISRKIVTRQADGTLKHSSMKTSKRIDQLYFPINGRNIRKTSLWESKYFQECLAQNKYKHLLDRLTVQYEPFEEEFHDISNKIYTHINENLSFDHLRSTRYFGPMAFCLAWNKNIDNLLYDMIRKNYLQNSVELIALLYKIHEIPLDYVTVLQKLNRIHKPWDLNINNIKKMILTNSISNNCIESLNLLEENDALNKICIQFIEGYITNHALKKVQLELALQNLKDFFEIKQNA